MKFATRKSAWIAMMVRAHLANLGITAPKFAPDGSATFTKHGAVWTVKPDLSVVRREPEPRPEPEPYLIPGSAQQFAASGDEWNAHNPQHDAYRPFGQRVMQNAFGDLCDKPTVEGYDQPYVRTHDRDAALARVRAEEARAAVSPVQARLLCNARVAYRKG
jgi:hypothetical protein